MLFILKVRPSEKMKQVFLTEWHQSNGGYAMKVIFRRVAVALAFTSSSLLAGTTSYSHTDAHQAVPFIDNFTLPVYTPTLGNTLTSITISLSYSTTGEVNIFNTSSLDVTFTNATTSTPLTLTAPASCRFQRTLLLVRSVVQPPPTAKQWFLASRVRDCSAWLFRRQIGAFLKAPELSPPRLPPVPTFLFPVPNHCLSTAATVGVPRRSLMPSFLERPTRTRHDDACRFRSSRNRFLRPQAY